MSDKYKTFTIEGNKMEWSKNLLKGKKTGTGTKLLQVKVDRNLSNEFKMVCVSLGKSQKEIVENLMKEKVNQFIEGKL